MAAAKIEAMWDQDAFGNHLLIISKKRGKLNLEEVGDFLRYSTSGRLQGHYVVVINATEATCGAQWGFDEAPQGDTWELYQVEEGERWQREPKPEKGWYIIKDSIVNGINPVTGYPYQHYTMRKVEPGGDSG